MTTTARRWSAILMTLAVSHTAFPRGKGGADGAPGRVTVTNKTGAAITVWLDAQTKLGELAPDAAETYDKVRGGTQRLRAHPVDLVARAWEAEILVIQSPVPNWIVGPPATTGIKVLNYTKDELTIYMEHAPWLVVPAGSTGLISMDGSPVTRMMSAKATSGKVSFSPRLVGVEDGKIREWKFGTAPAAAPAEDAAPAPGAGGGS